MKDKNRIRITKAEIEKARNEILSASSRTTAKKAKPKWERKYNNFWWGVLYCDHQGLAIIATPKDNDRILGKTEEILPMLKSRKVNKEDPQDIIKAVQQFQAENKNSSCHIASGKTLAGITTTPPKSNRATFKDNPAFLSILASLLTKGYGLPTIQSELKAKGYPVPYRTLGRWVQKRKQIISVG